MLSSGILKNNSDFKMTDHLGIFAYQFLIIWKKEMEHTFYTHRLMEKVEIEFIQEDIICVIELEFGGL